MKMVLMALTILLAILIIPALLFILFCILPLRKKKRSDAPPEPDQSKQHEPGER